MKQPDASADSRTPFHRFEDLTRRIVNVPRKDVPPTLPKTPRAKPALSVRKPKGN